jgi:hypothetical protein
MVNPSNFPSRFCSAEQGHSTHTMEELSPSLPLGALSENISCLPVLVAL